MVKANNYEVLYIVDLSKGEDAVRAAVDKFNGIIAENGTVQEICEWGKRRLAYPINDMNDGYYVLVYFAADASFPAELERRFGIDDAIMRGIVIRRETAKIPEPVVPAAVPVYEEEEAVEAAPAAAPAPVAEAEAAPADAE